MNVHALDKTYCLQVIVCVMPKTDGKN